MLVLTTACYAYEKKVFVANPNKAQPILDILIRNKSKLESFLSNFHNDNGLLPIVWILAAAH